jgi:hypothetical protein
VATLTAAGAHYHPHRYGAGTVLVGLSPRTSTWSSTLSARSTSPPNFGLILLGLALRDTRPRATLLSLLLGSLGLVGMLSGPPLVILAGHGGGLAERVALYPLIVWAILHGIGFVRSAARAYRAGSIATGSR